jgi:tetratricopeptide (TPR) repeat protein
MVMEKTKIFEAIQMYQKAIELDKNKEMSELHYNLSIALKQTRQFQQAASHLKDAIKIDPRNAIYHHQMSIILSLIEPQTPENIANSRTFMQTACELDPLKADFFRLSLS